MMRAISHLFMVVGVLGCLAAVPYAAAQAEGQAEAGVAAAEVAPGTGVPKIQVDKPEHDFGRITSSQKVSHDFKVTNVGTTDLTGIKAQASCGCTAVRIGQESLAPGESCTVRAEFDPKGFRNAGTVSKYVRILSNDPQTPEVRVTFRATIQDPLVTEPAMLRFNEVLVGTTAEETLEIRSVTEEAFEITKVESSVPQFQVSVDNAPDLPPSRKRVRVTIADAPNQQRLTGSIVVHTNHPLQPTLETSVYANVTGHVRFEPPSMYIPVTPGTPTTREIKIRPRAGLSDFTVSAVYCNVDFATAEITGRDGDAFVVTVTASAPEETPNTNRSGKLVVKTNVPGEEEAEMTLTVSVRQRRVPIEMRNEAQSADVPARP